MKKIFLFITLLLAFGCEKEDALNAPLGQPRRNYDVNSTNPVFKYVSQYYADYGKELIVDPDSSDWLYNFQIKNKVNIFALEQNEQLLLDRLDLMNEIFFDAYSKDVIKKFFPYNIIVAENILVPGTWSGFEQVKIFSARNFIALNTGGSDKVFTEEEKVELSLLMHLECLKQFIIMNHLESLNLENFLISGTQYYGKTATVKVPQEELYALGIISGTDQWYDKFTKYPTREEHAKQWVDFILKKSDTEINEIIDNYPVMKENYNFIIDELKASINIDLNNLVYKPKK